MGGPGPLSPCWLVVAKAERHAQVRLRGGLKRSANYRRRRAQTSSLRCDRPEEVTLQWRLGPHSSSLRCTYSKLQSRLGDRGSRRGPFLLILAPRCLGYSRVNNARGARDESRLCGDWRPAPRAYFKLPSKNNASYRRLGARASPCYFHYLETRIPPRRARARAHS